MTLEEAKQKVLETVNANPANDGKYKIDERQIIETDYAWYLPYVLKVPVELPPRAGAYDGYIVGKTKGDMHRPGSAYTIEKWLVVYELGILDGPHDLIILKVYNRQLTLSLLLGLKMQYVKLEFRNGVVWKPSQSFSEIMLEEKLAQIPCSFENQFFAFKVDEFQEIRKSKAFDYELRKTTG